MFLAIFMLMSGKGFHAGNNPPSNQTSCEVVKIPLILYQGNINPGSIPDRKFGYSNLQPGYNIFGGQKSAPNKQTEVEKNYCVITISTTKCSNYGKSGTKTYVWDSGNDGNSFDSKMNIEIPKKGNFIVTVELYESCGNYYNHGGFKRAKWRAQTSKYQPSLISISDWKFVGVEQCY